MANALPGVVQQIPSPVRSEGARPSLEKLQSSVTVGAVRLELGVNR